MQLHLHDPLDMHLHLRQEAMMELVAPLSAKHFSVAIIMPNTIPPITTKAQLLAYKAQIEEATKQLCFKPLMTLFFSSTYNEAFLRDFGNALTAIKLYPAGITTNSQGGVKSLDIDTLAPTLEAMSNLGIPLCVHGESSGFVMDREKEFASIYEALASTFPKLTIIMEHITDKSSVVLLEKYDNLYATITLHHLLITLDDLAGGYLRPHLFCKPIAKRPEDKEALLSVALEAHPKVMFGSDSAPHPRSAKEAPGCAAGVFSAPIALEALCELFESHNRLDNLQAFVSDNAKRIYGLKELPKKEVVLQKGVTRVPKSYGDVVPFMADEEISWSIKEIRC